MSDRVDTEAVREWSAEDRMGVNWRSLALALCDELDRTREALRAVRPHIWNGRIEQACAIIDAVLAESGNTDRCPTCHLPDRERRGRVSLGTRWVDCPDPWHAAGTDRCPSAPQVAPEPERCPTWRDEVHTEEAPEWGMYLESCHRSDCDLGIVRPGKEQCRGEDDEYGCWWTRDDMTRPAPLVEGEQG